MALLYLRKPRQDFIRRAPQGIVLPAQVLHVLGVNITGLIGPFRYLVYIPGGIPEQAHHLAHVGQVDETLLIVVYELMLSLLGLQ